MKPFFNGKTKRYSVSERKAIRRAIKAQLNAGLKIKDIAVALNAQGFKTPNGEQLTEYFVRNQLSCIRAAKVQIRAARVAKPEANPIVKTDMISHRNRLVSEILTNPGIADAMRIKMLTHLIGGQA